MIVPTMFSVIPMIKVAHPISRAPNLFQPVHRLGRTVAMVLLGTVWSLFPCAWGLKLNDCQAQSTSNILSRSTPSSSTEASSLSAPYPSTLSLPLDTDNVEQTPTTHNSDKPNSENPDPQLDKARPGCWLGAYTPTERRALGIPANLAVVGVVFPDSDAADKGLQVLDAIQSIDGQQVANYDAVLAAYSRYSAGDTANFEIIRRGQTIQVRVRFSESVETQMVLAFREAVRGNPQAQYAIGINYMLGTEVDKDARKGRFWLERAADAGVGCAWAWLGSIYETGDGVTQDLAKARELFEIAAVEDLDWALVRLAPMLLNGQGGTIDSNRGLSLYKRAAELGHAEASFQVAQRYFEGSIIERDYGAALRYFEQAARQGHHLGAARAGNMYGTGLGTAPDLNRSVHWLTMAADAGIADAQHDLGAMYSQGDGVTQDWGLAAKYLSAAAGQGNVISMYHLAELFNNSNPPQYEKAVHWFTKAAEAGHLPACSYLGGMYLDGLGVPRDVNRAAPLIRRAAEGGLPRGQFVLGRMYTEAAGVPYDYTKAVHWLTTAVSSPELESGNRAQALTLLGTIYDGIGVSNNVPRQPSLAIEYYRQAAELGQLDSQRLYGQRLRDQQRYSEAASWLYEAATRGDRAAQNDLAMLYYNGQGVTQSREEAIAWWIKAYQQGSTTARDSLRNIGVDAK